MDNSEEVARLLTEIRDLQKQHLAEYRAASSRAIKTQERAFLLYKRVLVAAAILLAGVGAGLYALFKISH